MNVIVLTMSLGLANKLLDQGGPTTLIVVLVLIGLIPVIWKRYDVWNSPNPNDQRKRNRFPHARS